MTILQPLAMFCSRPVCHPGACRVAGAIIAQSDRTAELVAALNLGHHAFYGGPQFGTGYVAQDEVSFIQSLQVFQCLVEQMLPGVGQIL